VVYFEKAMLATAYAVNNHSYACLAFKSEDKSLSDENMKKVFEKRFSSLGWKVPLLISLMNESKECYFNTIAQVRMPHWSKDNVVLVGDAAYSAQGMGTSLAITGAYILAREIEKAQGDFPIAFSEYERAMRKYVEDSQKLAEGEIQIFTSSSIKLKWQLYLMKILPKKILQHINEKRRVKMKTVANSLTLEQEKLH
jgi:2-polyprenyl-6-methoxyphenol hydroxylase-like FAD-dependent oxidoreductase